MTVVTTVEPMKGNKGILSKDTTPDIKEFKSRGKGKSPHQKKLKAVKLGDYLG